MSWLSRKNALFISSRQKIGARFNKLWRKRQINYRVFFVELLVPLTLLMREEHQSGFIFLLTMLIKIWIYRNLVDVDGYIKLIWNIFSGSFFNSLFSSFHNNIFVCLFQNQTTHLSDLDSNEVTNPFLILTKLSSTSQKYHKINANLKKMCYQHFIPESFKLAIHILWSHFIFSEWKPYHWTNFSGFTAIFRDNFSA